MRRALTLAAQSRADTPLELNIYGLSHHWDRAAAHDLHTDHEVNPGLGLHLGIIDTTRLFLSVALP
jgi:hypothetical protein